MQKGQTLQYRELVRINRGAYRGAIVTASESVTADQPRVWIRGNHRGELLHGNVSRLTVSKLPLTADGEPILFDNTAEIRTYADSLTGPHLHRICALLAIPRWQTQTTEQNRDAIAKTLADARDQYL